MRKLLKKLTKQEALERIKVAVELVTKIAELVKNFVELFKLFS